jgi:regulator of sigma E protease
VYGRRDVPTVIDTLVAGKPGQLAGLQRGDSVIAIDGKAVRTWSELVARVGADTGQASRFDVARGTQRLSFTITPEVVAVTDPITGAVTHVGKIGAGSLGPDNIGNRAVRSSMSLSDAFQSGWYATWSMGRSVLDVLGGLFRGTVSVKTLGGPIAIARTSVQAAKTGLESLFTLIAFLSINLAVLNLLPVPILDGGQVLITIAEGVKGSAFSDRTRENFMRVGLVAIGALFLVVMFNDLKGLVTSIFS